MRREIFGLAVAQFSKICRTLETQGHSDKRKEDFKKNLKQLSDVYASIYINNVNDGANLRISSVMARTFP